MSKVNSHNSPTSFSERSALRPKARLLRTLGNDLISSDKVAIIELVKNAFDADASIALIRFIGPLKKGLGRIEVWDDGHGMTAETLQDSWLNIATDMKKKNPKSKQGRRVLGEKGIGRLAAARLGDEMLLTSRMKNKDEVQVLIDWSEFDQDVYLDEVEVDWDVDTPDIFSNYGLFSDLLDSLNLDSQNKGHGTAIEIERLTREWQKKDVLELRTSLARLIRPRPNFKQNNSITHPDFLIYLDFVDVDDDIVELAGEISSPPELNVPHYTLCGNVDSEGYAQMHYTQTYPPVSKNIERNIWKDKNITPQSGPFDFEINVWDRESDAIKRTINDIDKTTPNAVGLKNFRDALSDVAGISIYRDGFRVLPFGEPGDDWLGLDLRRVQAPTKRVSNNQVVGHLFIGADTNSELKDQSNREGILSGPAYTDLQTLTIAILTEIENRRYTARRHNKKSSKDESRLARLFSLDEVHDAVIKSYPSDRNLIKIIQQKEKSINDGVNRVQRVLSQYSRLATLGTLIDQLIHDGVTTLSSLKNHNRWGVKILKNTNKLAEDRISLSISDFDVVTEQANLLDDFFKRLAPFGGRKRGRPRNVDIQDIVTRAIDTLRQQAEDNEVTILSTCPSLLTKIDDAELLAVLINLINNAIYWASQQPKEEIERKVVVDADYDDGQSSLTIRVSDSGPGVPEEYQDSIFDPYFSTKPDGVGLGLTIAGGIVREIYDGSLSLVDDGELSGATFAATFKRRVK